MFLEIKNIGKFNNAKIEIDGITVIAGPNNTGKSTIGKFLFCIFNAFYNLEKKSRNEKLEYCNKIILNNIFNHKLNFRYRIKQMYFSDFSDSNVLKTLDFTEKEITERIENFAKNEFNVKVNKSEIKNVIQEIYHIIEAPIEEYASNVLHQVINTEFKEQLINVQHRIGKAKLSLSNEIYEFEFKKNSTSVKKAFDGFTDVIYIDDPYIIDNGYEKHIQFYSVDTPYSDYIPYKFKAGTHQKNLQNQFYNISNISDNTYEMMSYNKKMDDIYSVLSNAVDGDFIVYNEKMAFEEKGNSKPIYLPNLSTGLKTFVILKKLMDNMVIREKDLVILDEPEIHLHPEWQLLLAEIIVLLQRELNLHILINTHSPYFLQAIEVYTAKYKLADRVKYYLTKLDEKSNYSVINDVTKNTGAIYDLLAYPLKKLYEMEQIIKRGKC